jgi:uroporphyrinogen decarboxylase
LEEVVACGGDVIGVDWRMPLADAWQKVGEGKAVMGNLDPVALLAPWRELKFRVDEVLVGASGRNGHIFNLGHGIFPNTPVDNVRRVVDYVHERTSKQ